MNKPDILLLCRYNSWANARILNTASPLLPEQFIAPAAVPHGSLRGTLVHVLFAEWLWRLRWQGVSPTTRFSELDFPTLQHVRARWAEEEKALLDFIHSVSDAVLTAPLDYSTTSGVPLHEPALWPLIMHLFNHGTQHRSEAAMMLTDFGYSPGDLDLITFLRQPHS